MNKGDVINGYEILQDFSVAGAGFSMWTFARKDGRDYFFKQFLSPTYPEADAPGSERIKARKRARCEVFESHQRRIMEATRPVSSLGGNLIVTLDFFRWAAKYYKVTEKVEVAEGPDAAVVAALGFEDQLVILKSVAHSLKVLHDLKIVHSDLKPGNILIKKTALAHTAKLIDFDSAYFTGDPPPPDQIVGTINYYSPELVTYIQDTEAADPHRLGLPSDVFTLGLIYTEYLTGQPPEYDRERYAYPATAARQGVTLRVPRDRVPADVPAEIVQLIDRMMLPDPAARPTIAEIHAALMRVRRGGPGGTAPVAEPVPAGTAAAAPSGLRGKGLRTATRPAPPAGAVAAGSAGASPVGPAASAGGADSPAPAGPAGAATAGSTGASPADPAAASPAVGPAGPASGSGPVAGSGSVAAVSEPAAVSGPSEPSGPAEPSEPSGPAAVSGPAEPSEPSGPAAVSEPAPPSEPSGPAAAARPPGPGTGSPRAASGAAAAGPEPAAPETAEAPRPELDDADRPTSSLLGKLVSKARKTDPR